MRRRTLGSSAQRAEGGKGHALVAAQQTSFKATVEVLLPEAESFVRTLSKSHFLEDLNIPHVHGCMHMHAHHMTSHESHACQHSAGVSSASPMLEVGFTIKSKLFNVER